MNTRYRKSVQATCEEFVEFFKAEVRFGVEQNKYNLHQKFIKRYKDYEHLKQNTFSNWLRIYASINGYKYEARSSSGRKLFTISKKVVVGK